MAKFVSSDNRPKIVFLSSVATSIVLVSLFLFGALLTNLSHDGAAYTRVDMAAGSIFVFVLSMIISLSLLPKIIDWRESREKIEKF